MLSHVFQISCGKFIKRGKDIDNLSSDYVVNANYFLVVFYTRLLR